MNSSMAAASTSSQKPRLFGGVWITAGEVFAGVGFVKLHLIRAPEAFRCRCRSESLGQKLALAGAMTTTRPQVPSRVRTALATPQRTGP